MAKVDEAGTEKITARGGASLPLFANEKPPHRGRPFSLHSLLKAIRYGLICFQVLHAENMAEQPKEHVCHDRGRNGLKKVHLLHLLSGQEPKVSIAKSASICYTENNEESSRLT